MCKDCYYNDGVVHAECVICDKEEKRGRRTIIINDNDLPITVAEKLITATKEETTDLFHLHANMFTQEDLREIAKYLLTYDLCHPNGD